MCSLLALEPETDPEPEPVAGLLRQLLHPVAHPALGIASFFNMFIDFNRADRAISAISAIAIRRFKLIGKKAHTL